MYSSQMVPMDCTYSIQPTSACASTQIHRAVMRSVVSEAAFDDQYKQTTEDMSVKPLLVSDDVAAWRPATTSRIESE